MTLRVRSVSRESDNRLKTDMGGIKTFVVVVPLMMAAALTRVLRMMKTN